MTDNSCTCLPVPEGNEKFDCVLPDPGCCVEISSNGEVSSCQCRPEGSGVCDQPSSMPINYETVATCPAP